ncbi:MAG TPA: hypothetical protein VE398_25665 [Acidobacteriota bacterium]|nr:hypothetical protein [Acidobacteriota bacterium]
MKFTGNARRQSGEPTEHDAGSFPHGSERVELERALAAFRDSARAAADRPEHFWERQRLSIRDRLNSTRRSRDLETTWIWASATAFVILVLTLLVPRGETEVPDIAAGQDQELLVAIERSLNREVPKALEPASILTEELDVAASKSLKK